ncbi:MAG: protein kinase [Bacteroides sp.]|nr:protein kinase [Bacteroides sp.]MCM1413799.1 protein kinase [Bacteroides sp.]MCM1472182.1 protein kinase [Bacteroides sp.]
MAAKSETEKWTDIELLPEWGEEFYDVYTAKKHGKWVMLKTLKPAYKDDPRFRSMIEKEFDVRYNLAHPHIVMINDYEDVPGLGRCIITDDVYGDSLRKLLDNNKITSDHVDKICSQLVDAIDYIQRNHLVHFPIRPGTIIFTENIGNLKLIDVGFDQSAHLTPAEASEDIRSFGLVLSEVLDHIDNPPMRLRRIADKASSRDRHVQYKSVHQLRMALANRSDHRFYIAFIAFLLLMIALLVWFSSTLAPAHG